MGEEKPKKIEGIAREEGDDGVFGMTFVILDVPAED